MISRTTTTTDDATTALPLAGRSDDAPLLGWLAPLWLLAIVAGALLLRVLGSAAGNEMTADRALFVATNAATLTGFAGARAESLGPPGRWVVLGLTVFGAFFTLSVGGRLLARAVGLRHSDRTINLTSAGALLVVLLVAAPLLGGTDEGAVGAAQLAVGAFGNSGIVWGATPGTQLWQTQLVLLPLATVGGLGVPVILELLDRLRGRSRLSRHARVTLAMMAGVYLSGTVLLCWLHTVDGRSFGRDVFVSSSSLSVNARSLGMPLERPSAWPLAVPWVVVLLMTVGAASGGTGGGLKVTTPAVLWAGVRRCFAGAAPGSPFAVALVWTTAYLLAIATTTVALVATVPQMAGDRLLFLAASAVGTVGLSHDPVSLVGNGLHTLTLAMLFGRLAPLVVLWWLTRTPDRAGVAVG